ncbi:MAG: Stk1 family PASTA domain-containing Ser/Thr kinase [Actinomycetes bacterium]
MDTTLRDPVLGRLVDGRYQVETRLATGGMAVVYRATDTRLDRTVALKVMHAHLASDPEFVERFIHEAKAAARLSDPGVVGVYDQGADGDVVFLTMEFVQGRTLREELRRAGRLDLETAAPILDRVLAALAAAHRAGLVHRDVKPENVLLAEDGRVKVADFGLARAVSARSGTTQGKLIGTVAYLAPERTTAGTADARSDVYSAGILFYEMLTGRKPYDGDDPVNVAFRHVNETVPAPSLAVAGIPPAIDQLVARATAHDPDRRPHDAEAMRTELVQAVAGLDQADRPSAGHALIAAGADGLDRTLVVDSGASRRVSATNMLELPDTSLLVEQAPDARTPASPVQPRPSDRLPRRRRLRGTLALLLVLLLAAGLSGAAWWVGAGPGAYTTTPSLLGLTSSLAQSRASAAGLTVRYAPSRYSETVPRDDVIATTPAPNMRIHKAAAITVVLSLGPERFATPTLVGLTVPAAQSALGAAHLVMGRQTGAYSTTAASGTILSSNPPAGTEVKRGSAVAVVVSQGPPPVPIPAVVGQPLAQAQSALTRAGLTSTVAGRSYSDTVPAGSVISASPSSGTAPKGSSVSLTVSQGPPPVPVPDVIGKSTSAAESLLTQAGFQVKITYILGGFFGIVRTEDPPGGQSAPKGSTIAIGVI